MKLVNGPSLLVLRLLLLITFLHDVVGAPSVDWAQVLRERTVSSERELKASSKTDSLSRRHSDFVLANEAEIFFTEGNSF